MPELIDTHVHLDDRRLSSQLDQVLAFAAENNVTKMINIGHNRESSIASVSLAREHTNIWAAVGFHPHSAKDLDKECLQLLKELAADPRVVAIGEIGLDYHYDFSPRKTQREAFMLQLELACQLGLPVVIHQREAVADTLSILAAVGPLPRGGVMHSFSGSTETMSKCIDLNLCVGLGGPVTFSNARRPKEAAASVPLDRLVLETDCPYLTPHPHRGKTNQPGYLPLIAAEIARLRGIDTDHLIAACTQNAKSLFNIAE
ncbi:MAG TPA: TatD family hydrolase [Bacillota bacterium]|nr:TatD family hydrolase [Bacillota bacterium]HPZ22149.1 TatD family hydrolase [Bacillota bacterium]HQD19736.1 TatD family hydrolase [Bacillota bacterium]